MSNSIDMSADMTKCPPGGDYNQLLLHRTPFFCSECVALLRHGGGGGGVPHGAAGTRLTNAAFISSGTG